MGAVGKAGWKVLTKIVLILIVACLLIGFFGDATFDETDDIDFGD